MHGLALVELQDPVAVGLLGDPDVLLLGLGLVQHPPLVDGLHRAHGQRDRSGEDDRQGDEPPAEPGRGDQRQRQGEDEEGPLGADQRDQHQGGQHRPGERADGRDRVEAPGDATGMLDVVDREPQRPGGAGPEQDDRDRDQRQDADQRADEGPCLDLVQRVDRDVEERPGDERDHGEQQRRDQDHEAEAADVGAAVGQPAPEPVADRERHEHHADRVRPDDRRGAEERCHQPRRGDLGPEAGRADDEDERVEEAVAHARPASRRGSARAGARPGPRRRRAPPGSGRGRSRAPRRARSAPASRRCDWRRGRTARRTAPG